MNYHTANDIRGAERGLKKTSCESDQPIRRKKQPKVRGLVKGLKCGVFYGLLEKILVFSVLVDFIPGLLSLRFHFTFSEHCNKQKACHVYS